MLTSLLITLHVLANLVWIGSIVSVGLMTHAASRGGEEGKVLGTFARRLYGGVAQPAFGLSFLFGVGVMSRDLSSYMHLHWFHGKLTAVIAVIALHHVIGARAKKVAGGSMQQGRTSAILTGALLLCALVAVTFVVFRQSIVP
jgi:putative membrane protein